MLNNHTPYTNQFSSSYSSNFFQQKIAALHKTPVSHKIGHYID